MGFLTDWLTDWLKELLIEGIMGNLTGLFDSVNSRVGEIAVQVGTTPAAWNAGVFSLIRQLSETVILPIAGLILTFVATYELIQLIIEKNNLHDLDYWIFFKWIFKTACAILILSNTFNIVMAVFDVSQSVIARAAGIVQGSTDISESMLADLEATLETLGLGSLLGLWLQSLLIHVTMWAINIVIFVIVYREKMEERKALLKSAKSDYAKAAAELDTLRAEVIKSLRGESAFPQDLLSSLISDCETKCLEVQHTMEAAQAAYDEGQAMLDTLNAQYDDIISWADMYDNASMESKKMIVSCLIRRVEVYRDYRLHIDFNIDFEQFSVGLDISAIAA